jgi:hypothetical protein
MKKFLSTFLRIGISVSLLVFLFRQIDVRTLWSYLCAANPFLLAAGFLFSAGVYVLCFFRWEMLLRASGINVGKMAILRPFAGGVFFNMFLPSTVGGDFVRGADLSVSTKKTGLVVATVFLDRLSGYIGLVIVAFCALFAGRNLGFDARVYLVIAGLAVVLVGLLLVLFNGAVYAWFERVFKYKGAGRILTLIGEVHSHLYLFRTKKRLFFCNILISLLLQCLSPISAYFICRSMGFDVQIIYFFVFMPVIAVVTLLPISLGGIGLREVTAVALFTRIGLEKNGAFCLSLVGTFYGFVIAAAAGLLYVFTLLNRRV